MSKNFCLLKPQIEELRAKMKTVGGKELLSMSLPELHKMFSPIVGEKISLDLAKTFKYAVISPKKDAISKWLKSNFTEKELDNAEKRIKDEKYLEIDYEYNELKKQIEQSEKTGKITKEQSKQKKEKAVQNKVSKKKEIENKKQEEILSEQDDVVLYSDGIIEKVLGTDVSSDMVLKITEIGQKMKNAEKLQADNQTGLHDSYYEAINEMTTYINTVQPMDNFEILSSNIFRANKLGSIKSPLLNITSNIVNQVLSVATNRATELALNRKVSGVATKEDYVKYTKFAVNNFWKNNIDVTRIMSPSNEVNIMGEYQRQVGNQSGFIPAWGRFNQQYIYKGSMGLADVASSAIQFIDTLSYTSKRIAREMANTGKIDKSEVNKKARELFEKAITFTTKETDPDFLVIKYLKETAVANAMTSTYQEPSRLAQTLLKVRNSIDVATGRVMLGTNLINFVKTVANVARQGFIMAGFTMPIDIPFAMVNFRQIIVESKLENPDLKKIESLKKEMAGRVNNLVKYGFGYILVTILAGLIDDDEYIPLYNLSTPEEKELAKLKGIGAGHAKIGGISIDLTYLGPLSIPLAMRLNARRKEGYFEKGKSIAFAGAYQVGELPVVSQLMDVVGFPFKASTEKKNGEELAVEVTNNVFTYLYSSLVPAIFGDFAKAIDDRDRYTDYSDLKSQIQAKIPYARELLPQKYDSFGNVEMYKQPYNFFSKLLMGERLKYTKADSEVLTELSRLNMQGNSVLLKVDSLGYMKELKKEVSGKEYNDINGSILKATNNAIAYTMSNDEYLELEDDEKEKVLQSVRLGAVIYVLHTSGMMQELSEETQEKINKQMDSVNKYGESKYDPTLYE